MVYLLLLNRGRYKIVFSIKHFYINKTYFLLKKKEYFYSKFHIVNKYIDDGEQKGSFILKHKSVVIYRNYYSSSLK